MLGIEVVGVIIAGWASNNKWSVYGAMREACQMVSYEIPMGMSLLIPVMTAGTLQLTAIADRQGGGFHSWFVFANPWCFAAFFTYYIAALASCKRAPFDLPESESELVAGFHTEYSGFRWSLFFFGEYVAMFVVSGLAVILFLGGWKSPFPPAWAPAGDGFFPQLVRGLFFEGPILFVLKSAFLYYVQLWVRWTLPRIRIDQVLYACVQVMLPLTMVLLLGNTVWILGLDHLGWGWLRALDTALHAALVVVGYLLVAAMLGIAAYGYANKRRLVGSLVVDHLPGA
jgi:NADH-quinone oxidoreductase subunit H